MAEFPSVKAKRLLSILTGPLGYSIVRQRGSHRRLVAPNRRPFTFAFHDRETIAPGLVRKILVRDVGLEEDDALDLL